MKQINNNFPNLLTRAKAMYVRSVPWDFLKSRFFYSVFRKVNQSDGLIRVSTKHGAWFANPKDYVTCDLYAAGVWEFSVTSLFERLIAPGDVIVDVGANFGYYSVLAANLVTDSGKVYAYECAPECLSLLKRNLRLNQLDHVVEVREVALSDSTGEAEFFLNRSDSGLSSIHPSENSETINVQMDRMDSCVFDSRLKLVKIDVEGAELQVLQGMQGLFDKNIKPFVICEITRPDMTGSDTSHNELLEFMKNIGYRVMLIQRQERRFPPFEPLAHDFPEITRYPEGENQIEVLFAPKNESIEVSW